jgi:hypothetical protein
VPEDGRWKFEHCHPGPLDDLLELPGLTVDQTRAPHLARDPAVCACGDESGAAYYAWKHNLNGTNDTPIMIEFETPSADVAVDGRDMLYTVFSLGAPDRATPVLRQVFGDRILRYAQAAWACPDAQQRIAICDLAVYDPAVIESHHANDAVLGGRFNTIFKSAFLVKLPIPAEAIVRAWIPPERPPLPQPEILFDTLLE